MKLSGGSGYLSLNLNLSKSTREEGGQEGRMHGFLANNAYFADCTVTITFFNEVHLSDRSEADRGN